MTEQDDHSAGDTRWGGDEAVEVESYRTYCVTAFCGLGLGLLSLVAFAYPLMWILPLAAGIVSALALRKIAADPDRLIGRRAALVGLAVSVLIGIGAPTRVLAHRWATHWQTRRFAEEWFQHLADGNPHFALEMTRDIRKRRALSDDLWRQYRDNAADAEALRQYIRQPVVAALLALGDSANVRFYQTRKFTPIDVGDAVDEVFAVTYEDRGKPKTFFVSVAVGRDFEPYKGMIPLRIFAAEGGVEPVGWDDSTG
ncbi:MAG: hypothetical protein KDA63_18430 [Planctomycetales bacterium]|nr:hypothetical protein [Planctomycetales bacterium]